MAEKKQKAVESEPPTAELGRDSAVGFRVGCSTWGGVHVRESPTPQRRPGADPNYDEV